MNRIVDFYESNHLFILIIVIIAFCFYIFSMKNKVRSIVTMDSNNEENQEIFDIKIETYSIVKLKYILTGEVITCDFARNKSNIYKKPSRNIKRIYFDNPLAVAIFGKEAGDIIKYKENEIDDKDIYVEVINVNNTFFTEEEIAMYGNNDIKLQQDNELEEFRVPIINGTIINSKDNLIKLLNIWLEKTVEMTIGDIDNFPKYTKWISLNLNGNIYFINSDSSREGIKVFVKNHENNNSWKIILNRDSIFNKVSNDAAGKPIKGLYFYSEVIGQREI